MRRKLRIVLTGLLVGVWAATTHTQVGVGVQNGFQPCAGVNCVNDLTLGATTATNGTVLRYATVTMTNAEALLLASADSVIGHKTIIAAPGAGKLVEVLGGMIIFDYTGAYTETGGDDNWRLYYGDSSKESASNVIETTGLVDATADTVIRFGPVANDQLVAGDELSNTAVVLSGVTGGTYNNLGGGNASNVFRVVIAYRIIVTGL